MSFAADLHIGQDIELKVLALIQRKYPCACIVDRFKGYDIWIPELHKSVEVKYDVMSCQTGNMVIEIEFNGKPSALMTTTADHWIFYDGVKYLWITPAQIIHCIFMNKLQYVEFVGKGDIKPKKAFLVAKDVLFMYGKVLQ